jgi:hypothetical protein
MHPSKLTRRHALMLGLAALFMAAGLVSAVLMRPASLDRAALARLMAEAAAAEEPATTGSAGPANEQMLMPR